MNRKKIFLFSFFLSLGALLNAQTENTAVVWRGFEHSWSYNHRINRIGNYVKMVSNDPYGYHASASGLGSDTKGSMFWKGWNANSSADEALSKTKINH